MGISRAKSVTTYRQTHIQVQSKSAMEKTTTVTVPYPSGTRIGMGMGRVLVRGIVMIPMGS